MGIKLSTQDVISHSAYETSINGYVKRSDDEDNCTANKVFDSVSLRTVSQEDLESVKDRVTKWLDYISSQSGDYFEDIKLSIAQPKVDEAKIGLIASSFASFDRYQSYKVLNEIEKQSEYLGEEGDFISFEIKDFKMLKTGTSKFKGSDSKWYLYKIHDINGNSISLFSNENLDKEFKKHARVECTIQKLSEFNGVKQTQVSGVRFID
jgi:hypothetical protein